MNFLIAIWPKLYRIVNGTLYFVFGVIKGIIVYALRQIRGEV